MKRLITNQLSAFRVDNFGSILHLKDAVILSSIRHGNINSRLRNAEQQNQIFPTTYDFDSEKAAATQSYTSLDCVMETSIAPLGWGSWQSLKARASLWMSLRRLRDRRPDLTKTVILDRYLQYKRLSHSRNDAELMNLGQFTTPGEAMRLRETRSAELRKVKMGSKWRHMAMTDKVPGNYLSSKSKDLQNGASSHISSDVYSLEVIEFTPIASFYGCLPQEDWLQITYCVKGLEYLDGKQKPEKVLEYSVMEFRLTDGIVRANAFPPIVVAVMDSTGCRHGRDGMDAVQLRKQMKQKLFWSA